VPLYYGWFIWAVPAREITVDQETTGNTPRETHTHTERERERQRAKNNPDREVAS